jgi:hypothetical protein
MSRTRQDQSLVVTEHALLIADAQFAEQIGLLSAMEHGPFKMKTITHRPADKVSELLSQILSGGMHINALSKSAHPLGHDHAVAHALGQQSFASASGVSQLLPSVSLETVEALKRTLDQVSDPDRRRMRRALSPSSLGGDFDLTGYRVSDQAITSEGADFGPLGRGPGAVARGDPFARAQVIGDQDVFVLGGFRHSGRTVEKHCRQERVALTEAQVGRPRRRVACIDARWAEAARPLRAIEADVAKRVARGRCSARRERLIRQREERQPRTPPILTRAGLPCAWTAPPATPLRWPGSLSRASRWGRGGTPIEWRRGCASRR